MTQQNIKLNNVRSLNAKLINDKYYDFMLYKGEVYGSFDPKNKLVADFSCPFNIEEGTLYSTAIWSEAINETVDMDDIGFTGVDNGFISFRKDRISNQDFLNILTGSTYHIDEGDVRFFLNPVTGNTLNFDYPLELVDTEDDCYIAFKGGFYQGFYKLFGFKYQTLPYKIDTEWNISFTIRPRNDYEVGVKTINHIHPENKGIFFYMGTRAENKFWSLYKTDESQTEPLKKESLTTDGYLDPSTCGETGDTLTLKVSVNDNLDYLTEEPEEIQENTKKKCKPQCSKGSEQIFHITDLYTYKYQENSVCCSSKPVLCGCASGDYETPSECDTYFQDSYFVEQCSDGNKAIDDEYMQRDIEIKENEIEDSFGHELLKKGYYEIESDNKFLMFDRTRDGFNVHNWIEGTKVTLTARQDWANINYFPLMNRTSTGYTVDTIYKYQEENSIPYNIYKDIKNNAFALRVTEDGAIGYRYSILDCYAENDEHYSVIEEYSKNGLVKTNEWNNVVVKFAILNPTGDKCNKYYGKRTMKIYIYVNGYLVFVSKELKEFNFRELNDTYQKQEGVPYNISLGGGTQGLLESILPDYYNTPEYIFPIEKDFCGSFLGDIKSFKIYDGVVNYLTIRDYLSKK